MKRKVLTKLHEVQDWFRDRKEVLAFDFETTGLHYLTMEPVGISFCDGERVCYIDLWENGEKDEICKFICDAFQFGTFIAHNFSFDLKCCKKFFGQRFNLKSNNSIFDTYIAAFLLDENRYSHSLKVLAEEDLGIPGKDILKWEQAENCGRHSKEFYNYAMNDSIWAYRLYQLYRPQLEEQGLWYVFSRVEMPFVPVVAEMEINGVLVDKSKLMDLQNRVQTKLLTLEDEMFASVGKKIDEQLLFGGEVERLYPINLKSSKQLLKLLKKHGVYVPYVQGKQSLDKHALEKLKGKHPFIDKLLEYRMFRKLYDSYIIPAWSQIDDDGRIRPNFGIVKTGRTNCRSPNLQQLPKVRDKTFNYRSIFTSDEGSCLVGADYSGQELRGLGEISQDANIIRAFDNNIDLHLLTANSIFDLGLEDEDMVETSAGFEATKKKYDSERYKAKNGANFPIIYGSTFHGVSFRMGVSKEEAKKWIDGFFKLYPDVKKAMDETRKELREKGYVTTLFGRRRRFPLYNESCSYDKARMVRQAFNFKIQGLAADQVKIAAAKALKMGLRVILIIHDEIVTESKNPVYDSKILEDCMVNAISLSIPFKVEIKSGNNYAEIK